MMAWVVYEEMTGRLKNASIDIVKKPIKSALREETSVSDYYALQVVFK